MENSEDPMEQEKEYVDENTNLVTKLFNTEITFVEIRFQIYMP